MLNSGAPSGGTFLALENGADANNNSEPTATDDTEGRNGKSDNLLMPPPPARLPASSKTSMVPLQKSSDSSTVDSGAISTPSIDHRASLVEYLPKPSLPDIHPPATRFPYQSESRLLPNNNDSLVPGSNRGSIRSSGSYTDTTASDTDLDASLPPLDKERASYQRARLREHETFVAMTPLIRPGGGGSRSRGGAAATDSDEPIMTWGDVASTPLVLGGGTAVDGPAATSADWEPTRPASLSVEDQGVAAGPAFDVVNESGRETMARRAEKKLSDRGKTYRDAGCSGLRKREREKDDDESSVRSSRSTMSSATTLDRTASLTPAARALLEASNNARQAKKKSSNPRSSIFQTSSSASRSSGASIHAGSRDSFGSALRMSYTPNATTQSSREASRKRKSSSSSSSVRRAAGGATPRCR